MIQPITSSPFFPPGYFVNFRGSGRIAGSLPDSLLTKAGIASSEWVYLLWRTSNKVPLLVALQKSKVDGSWSFDWLDETQKYDVVAHDSEGNFNSVIRANITPAPMP